MTTCRLCFEDHYKLLYLYDDCRVIKCHNCGFIQVAEHPGEEYLNKLYSNLYFNKGKYIQDKAAEIEQKRRLQWILETKVPLKSKMLDIGCATGDFLAQATSYFDIAGQDRSQYAIEQVKSRFSTIPASHFTAGPIEELEFPEASFDCITLWDVIEHLWNPHILLEKIRLWLKPKGILALSTPNTSAFTFKILGRYWAFMTPPEHLCFFNLDTISHLFEKYGFKLLRHTSVGKSVNLGFLMYKVRRTMPFIMPQVFLDTLRSSRLGNCTLYVPTSDILYVSAVKN